MKQFDETQKRMPYAESKDYLDSLIERATEQAIRQPAKPKTVVHHLRPLLAAASVVLLLVALGVTMFDFSGWGRDDQYVAQDLGPIDEFLNSLTDDEVQLLAYYDMDEFPEY